MHFIAEFEDGEIIEGESIVAAGFSLRGTGWRDLPDKPIARLSLVNPFGDLLILQGYDEYNFFVEYLQPLGRGQAHINEIYLMGAVGCTDGRQKDGEVTVYRISARPGDMGDVIIRKILRGYEYYGTGTTGWRKGIDQHTPNPSC